MKLQFWESQFGRVVCSLITKNEHVFSGWGSEKRGLYPGEPLPFVYCERCGREY